jgi:hypothetical protein
LERTCALSHILAAGAPQIPNSRRPPTTVDRKTCTPESKNVSEYMSKMTFID